MTRLREDYINIQDFIEKYIDNDKIKNLKRKKNFLKNPVDRGKEIINDIRKKYDIK